jgi:hypothetical protein
MICEGLPLSRAINRRVPHPFTPFVKGARGDPKKPAIVLACACHRHNSAMTTASGAPGSVLWNLDFFPSFSPLATNHSPLACLGLTRCAPRTYALIRKKMRKIYKLRNLGLG